MGVLLYLEIAKDSEAEYEVFSHNFLEEIIYDWGTLLKHQSFLTREEIEAIQPNECGEIWIAETPTLTSEERVYFFEKLWEKMKKEAGKIDEQKFLIREGIISEEIAHRARDPLILLRIIRKIETYMQEHTDEIPLIHKLYKSEQELLSDDAEIGIPVEGILCNVEGDLYYEDDYTAIRTKIRIKIMFKF